MWCEGCANHGRIRTFWPLTTDFWNPNYGLQRCRACHAQKKRIEERKRKARLRSTRTAAAVAGSGAPAPDTGETRYYPRYAQDVLPYNEDDNG